VGGYLRQAGRPNQTGLADATGAGDRWIWVRTRVQLREGARVRNFSKPDVHVKDIFWTLELSPWGTSDYEVFKAVARMASNVGVTPYNVVKLFWLIGSGYFYGNPEIGNNGKIGRRKKQFIEKAQTMLEQAQCT
jgi:hypothetical protein